MKVKVNKETLLKTYKSVIESYYSDIDDINDYNLDKYVNYKANGKIKLQVREHNGLKYLAFYKQDRDMIQQIIPISDYMYNKLLKDWFVNKYNVDIDSVLLPFNRYD
jgi:transcriptional accessory protein Tex/SPT6